MGFHTCSSKGGSASELSLSDRLICVFIFVLVSFHKNASSQQLKLYFHSLFLHDCESWYLTLLQDSRLKAILVFPPMTQQRLLGQCLFIVAASRPRSYKRTHSVGLLWTRDQPDTKTSTWKHVTIIRDRHSWPWRDSNPQFQQASESRPTP
jgi:hypothetical protein